MQEEDEIILYDMQQEDDMKALYHKLTDSQKSIFVSLQQFINTNAESVIWEPLLEFDKNTKRLSFTHYHKVHSENTPEPQNKKFLIAIAPNGTFIHEDDPAFDFVRVQGNIS